MKKKILKSIIILIIIFLLYYNPISCRILTLVYAKKYNINKKKFYKLIKAESSFRAWTNSSTGAIGLGQIQPLTGKYIEPTLKSHYLLYIPNINLKISCKYINYLLKKYNNNWSLSLAAYNWGETNVDKQLKKYNITNIENKNYFYLFKNIKETSRYIYKISGE